MKEDWASTTGRGGRGMARHARSVPRCASFATPVQAMAGGATRASDPTWCSDLCRQALAVYERLYRRLEWDEPDVGANIGYAVGRTRFERRMAAQPWQVPAHRARRVTQLVAMVADLADPSALERWFADFPDRILRHLDRRTTPSRSRRAPGFPDHPIRGTGSASLVRA
jgi:hypothetical protein